MAEYEVWILHPATGVPLLLADDFETLEYAKSTNDLGAFTFAISEDAFDISMAQKDGRVVVWRQPEGGKRAIDFAGLIRFKRRQYMEGKHTLVLKGPCYNHILGRRIIAYNAGTAQALKYQAADDLEKALVRENLGASATADRNLVTPGYLSVQANAGAGTVVWKQACRRQLLTTLQEVSLSSMETPSTGVWFGVVPLNRGFDMEFRTNVQQWGQDHRHPGGIHGPQIFALERNNMAEPWSEEDAWDEITFVYVQGSGQADNCIILPVQDAARIGESPLNRCETLLDESSEDYISRLGSAGRAALEEGRPKKRFGFSIIETPASLYGVHWGHGDLVTGSYEGEQYDLHVAAVQVTVKGQREEIRANLEYAA